MTLTTLTAQLENRSTGNRTDVVTHGVGLLRGELGPADLGVTELRVDDGTLQRRVQWRPIGRRYGSGGVGPGSYKYIEVSYPTTVTSASPEPTVTISQGTASTLTAYGLSAATTTGVATASIAFQVNGTTVTIPLSTIVQVGNRIIDPGTNGCKARYRYRGRMATATANNPLYGVGFEVVLDLYSQLDYCNFYIKFYYSVAQVLTNTTNPIGGNGNAWNDRYLLLSQPTTFVVTGATAYCQFENSEFTAVTHVGAVHTFTLQDPTSPGSARAFWPVGFCWRRYGRMYFDTPPTGAANGRDTRGMAMDWPSKNSPPYNFVADYPAYITSRANAIARLNTFRTTAEANVTAGEPLHNGSLFCLADSPRAGDAGLLAFGANQCYVMLRAGHPALLDVMEREAFKDSYRLGEYYTDNGEFWDSTARPNVNIWHGRLYYVNGHDGLGVNYPPEISDRNPYEIPIGAVTGAGPWLGLDREHWATIGQMHAALTGCNYLLLDQFETLHTQSAITTNYVGDSPLGNRPGLIPPPTSARDWGRGSATACCTVYEVSGHAGVLGALKDRLQMVVEPTAPYDDRREYLGNPGVRGTPPMPTQNFPLTRSGWGFWEGGFPIWPQRMAPVLGGNANFNSQSLSVQNDRPWVCSTAVAGAWAAYKLLLDTEGSTQNNYVTWARYVAGDLAQMVARYGIFFMGRNDSNGYRMFRMSWTSVNPRYPNVAPNEVDEFTELDAYNHANFVGRVIRGTTNGASGTIVCVSQGLIESGDKRDYIVWVRDCNQAPFGSQPVEVVGTSITGNAVGSLAEMVGVTSLVFKDDASFPTRAEIEDVFVSTSTAFLFDIDPSPTNEIHQYRGETLLPRNILFYQSYTSYAMAPVMVAWRLALDGFYQSGAGNNNDLVLSRARAVYAEMKRLEDSTVTSTWTDFQNWAGAEPVPVTGPQPPGIPTNLRTTNVTETSFTANWDPGSGIPTFFNVRHRELPGGSFVDDGDVPGTTFFKVITGLTADTLYEWTVNARNGDGTSAYATPVEQRTLATPPTPPAPPVNEDTENITTNSFTLTFEQVGDDIDSFQTRYRVEGAGVWTTGPTANHSVGGDTIRVPITGLVADEDYEAQARSVKGTAVSAYTASALAHTLAVPGDPPGAPTIGAPTFLTSGGFQVNWTPADLLEDEFEVNYRVTGVGLYTALPVPARTYSWSIDGLVAGTTYDVYVTARNGNGENDSAIIQVTTVPPLEVPSAPDSLDVDNIYLHSSLLHWRLTSTNHTEVFLRYGLTGGSWIDVDPLPPGTTSYALNNLEAGEEYRFQVATRNSVGDSPWSTEFIWDTLASALPLNPGIYVDFDDLI